MIVINNVDSQKFSFNGVEYFKNFTPVVVGNKIRVLNTYDSSIELTDAPRLYSDFEVNGVVYGNVINLQTALLPILYTRNSLVGDFLSSDISTYTPATTPLSGTEKALIHDGTDFKEVAVSEFGGDLQSVTDNGNSTTNEIVAGNFVTAGSGNFAGIILNDGDLNQIASITSLATISNPRSYNLPDKNGTVAMLDDIPLNQITGTGTINRLPKFTSSSNIGNSILQETSTTVKGISIQSVTPTNTSFGYNVLTSGLLSGVSNTGFGHNVLSSLTTGSNNSAIGYDVLKSITNGNNNTGFGFNCLSSLSTGSENNSFGYLCLNNLTSGSANTVFGVGAGRFIADGVTGLTTSNQSIFLGNLTKSLANNSLNEIVIGYNAIGNGNNTATIGNDSITKTLLKGSVGIGTTTPGARLDIRAQGALSTDIVFRVRNSANTANLLSVNGQGTLSLGLQSSAPTGIEGAIYYDSTTKKHYGFDGTTWNALY